jgi:UDP-2-acetamido-3-amino-2,3-dideoxy-glucuronate N-acetyltransferase
MTYSAHETAVIDSGSTIGSETKIWHFSHVLTGVHIGDHCSFGQNCVIGPNVLIGSGVKVQNNVSIYEGVEIEDDVFLGPSMVFTNVMNPRSFIVRKESYKPTLVQKGSTVGANATIVCGTVIGRYAMIGAGSVITKNVPNFALVYGVPGRQMGWVSKAGNPLTFDEKGIAKDLEDDSRYFLKNNQVIEVVS